MIHLKKTRFACVCTAMVLFTITMTARAENPQSEPKEDAPAATSADRKNGSTEGAREDLPPKRDPEARRPGRPSDHLIGQFTRLRDEMRETMQLTAAQEEKIDALFEGQLQALRRRGPFREGGESTPDPEADVKLLRQRMRDARERGDTETVNRLREEIRLKNEELYKSRADSTRAFLDAVRKELDDAQKEKFQEIALKLRLEGGPRGPAEELARLMRAIRDPKVGTTDAQLSRINEIFRNGFTRGESGPGGEAEKWDAKKVEESVRRLHERVLKELSSDQQKVVEEILAQQQTEELRPLGPRGDRERIRQDQPRDDSKDD